MKVYVVDASVAVKWYLPEVHAEPAARLLAEEYELHAPDLLLPEFGNILWKKFMRGELSQAEVRSIAKALAVVPLRIHASQPLLEGAVELALRTSRTVYDCLYLALAIHLGCALVTADDRLHNALQASSLSSYIRHLGGS